jgi:two-component system, chemotaxis family, sensor kinase Cph1
MTNQIIKKCEDEEIQLLNDIQPFGYLLGIHNETHRIEFYSKNIDELFDVNLSEILNAEISEIHNFNLDYSAISELGEGDFYRVGASINSESYIVTCYNTDDLIYVELEKSIIEENRQSYYNFSEQILYAKTIKDTWKSLTIAIKSLINYDRVMLYQFLEDGSGIVIEEQKKEGLDTYLGLRFPEFDIPKQARDLYLKKKSRMVSDVNGIRIPLVSVKNRPIDLKFSSVRALSPNHLQYLRNADCYGSFSVSIIVNDKLWGIIACQNTKPNYINAHVRMQVEMLTRIARLNYSNLKSQENLKYQSYFNEIAIQLKENVLVGEDLGKSISKNLDHVLNLTEANGIALLNLDKIYEVGEIPEKDEIIRIKNWAIEHQSNHLFSTNSFLLDYGDELNLSTNSAGVMFCFLDQNCKYFMIWFKKEQSQKQKWAGNPTKIEKTEIVGEQEIVYLSPRTSFKLWQEDVENKSPIWKENEIYIAKEVVKIIIETLHVQSFKIHHLYERLKEINDELDSFSYTISHDLRTPLTVMKLNCQMLQRSFKDDVTSKEKIKGVISEIDRMTEMMQEILALSKAKKSEIVLSEIEPKSIIEKIIEDVKIYYKSENSTVVLNTTEHVLADKTMVYEVFLNVIGNAVKYSSQENNPKIIIDSHVNNDEVIYHIKDNGIGIKSEDQDKMFKLFSRMSNTGTISGNGVGLSITHRMMNRMSGNITYESVADEGTTFILTFKKP